MLSCWLLEDIIQGTPDQDIKTDVPINNSPTIAQTPISELNSFHHDQQKTKSTVQTNKKFQQNCQT